MLSSQKGIAAVLILVALITIFVVLAGGSYFAVKYYLDNQEKKQVIPNSKIIPLTGIESGSPEPVRVTENNDPLSLNCPEVKSEMIKDNPNPVIYYVLFGFLEPQQIKEELFYIDQSSLVIIEQDPFVIREIEVRDPSGNIIPKPSGIYAPYVLKDPAIGQWKLIVDGTKLKSKQEYSVSVRGVSKVNIDLFQKGSLKLGSPFELCLYAFDGLNPIRNLKIEASLIPPKDGTPSKLIFHNGTIYTAKSEPIVVPGSYMIGLSVSGEREGGRGLFYRSFTPPIYEVMP